MSTDRATNGQLGRDGCVHILLVDGWMWRVCEGLEHLTTALHCLQCALRKLYDAHDVL